MKLNSLLNPLGRFISKAGSEESTDFRWWDSRIRCVLACRLDLNHPPTAVTAVGGISEFSHRGFSPVAQIRSKPRNRLNGFVTHLRGPSHRAEAAL